MLEHNIEQLEAEILDWIDEVWGQQVYDEEGKLVIYRVPFGVYLWESQEHSLRSALFESIRRLRERWPEDQLGCMIADMYFNPGSWIRPYMSPDEQLHIRRWVISTILDSWVKAFLPPCTLSYVETRLTYILAHPGYNEKHDRQESGGCWPPNLYMAAPRENDCLDILLRLPATTDCLDLLERIVRGDLDVSINIAGPGQPPEYTQAYSRYHLWVSGLMQRLFEHGHLSYDLFIAAMQHCPRELEHLTARFGSDKPCRYVGTDFDTLVRGGFTFSYTPEFGAVITQYVERLVNDILEQRNEETCYTLKLVKSLSGPRWLLTAAELHRDFKLNKLVVSKGDTSADYLTREGIDTVVIHLARAADLEPTSEAERADLVAQLRAFPTQTLKYLLPVTLHGRDILLEALGWRKAAPLIEETLMQTASRSYRQSGHTFGATDIPNSNDPESGIVDVASIRAMIDAVGEETAQEVYELFRETRIGVENAAVLLEAVGGWNRAKIEQGLGKRNQLAVKAFGLLPLQRGLDEAVERYTTLKQFAKESRKFGPERQANERAAVQTAMANLAQVAGYRDVMQLEWDMEARLSAEVAPVGQIWEMGDYQIQLVFADLDAQLVVTRDGKPIKTPPQVVRQSAEYITLKETVKQLREQVRRFKMTFEGYLALATSLTRTDLANLNRMPAAQAVLSRLILQTSDGILGLYIPEEFAIVTLAGERYSVTDTAIIAHPYHLFTQGQIEGWQREIIRHRIVQPFKQTFRELYIVTPAEREAGWFSNRFAGHAVEGKVAARLFQTRQWEIQGGDVAVPSKIFREQGIEARFTFPDVGHYFGEMPFTTSDQIMFRPYPSKPTGARFDPESVYLPLADIPPWIFSEVMRDADLVVSVAQRDRDGLMSHETFQRRGELVTALFDELRLPGVTIDGHHAQVRGKLANYRVHLGSAAIHIEPGSYLCVVPDRWGKSHKNLFLPFADTGDDTTSEVISKILLLVNDDKIKDESILRQIKSQTQG